MIIYNCFIQDEEGKILKTSPKMKDNIYSAICLFILAIYWAAILCINFSQDPSLYCTDMYSDMIYSTEVWASKSIFPEGWVFGNQLYAVATPVLAALFFGCLPNPCIAMGIATTVMGIGVIISFTWMLKPVFTKLHERLAAVVFFMTSVLLCGDCVHRLTGWQLFFTMCSYYACYAIAAFLAFGCYLRSNKKWTGGYCVALMLACIFSFGTGIQSLRQTVIMILPLIAAEGINIMYYIATKRVFFPKSILTVGLVSVANLAGVVFSSFADVEKKSIYGSIQFHFPDDFFRVVFFRFADAFNLFSPYRNLIMVIFCLICAISVIIIFRNKEWWDNAGFLCIFLHIISVAGIVMIDIFSEMHVREIYYFLLYPFVAIILTFVYSRITAAQSLLIIVLLILTFTTNKQKLQKYLHFPEAYYPIQQVSEYLEKNEITTVYSYWNLGEKIAIASDFRIQAGFWNRTQDFFNPVKYLCNPDIYDMDAEKCAYVVKGKDAFDKANIVAQEQNEMLYLMQYFPEFDFYVFICDQKLMK